VIACSGCPSQNNDMLTQKNKKYYISHSAKIRFFRTKIVSINKMQTCITLIAIYALGLSKTKIKESRKLI